MKWANVQVPRANIRTEPIHRELIHRWKRRKVGGIFPRNFFIVRLDGECAAKSISCSANFISWFDHKRAADNWHGRWADGGARGAKGEISYHWIAANRWVNRSMNSSSPTKLANLNKLMPRNAQWAWWSLASKAFSLWACCWFIKASLLVHWDLIAGLYFYQFTSSLPAHCRPHCQFIVGSLPADHGQTRVAVNWCRLAALKWMGQWWWPVVCQWKFIEMHSVGEIRWKASGLAGEKNASKYFVMHGTPCMFSAVANRIHWNSLCKFTKTHCLISLKPIVRIHWVWPPDYPAITEPRLTPNKMPQSSSPSANRLQKRFKTFFQNRALEHAVLCYA